MSEEKNSIEFDNQINGYLVKYRCPNCGRKYKVTMDKPHNKNVRCNYCKYMVKIRVNQNGISVA
ncbi:MAG: hypothetical protein ACTSRG_06720 [Candidatus Helarchaeota archaeon]